MSWLADTLAGRAILILVAGLGLSLAFSHFVYEASLERELREMSAARIADRLVILPRTLMRVPSEERDAAAHQLSAGPIEVHWSRQPLTAPGGTLDPAAARLRDVLLTRTPELARQGLVIGTSRAARTDHATRQLAEDDHLTLLSLRMEDGSWVNVSLAPVRAAHRASPSILIPATIMAVAIALVSALMGSWLTEPLRRVAEGARRLYAGAGEARIPASGTREVRALAEAFNEMQGRIQRLVEDRTQTLAAVSHDLRTPLTRLRLRVESVGEEAERRAMVADLDEMEAMLDAALAFLRGEEADGPIERLDLGTMLETIANDMSDAGASVALRAPRHLVVQGRRLALKRALTNLVQNAIKYGEVVEIEAKAMPGLIAVTITDQGPGIPPDQLEAVFQPFYRLDASRSRDRGGYGLGLTLARTVLRAHGGDVHLANRIGGGLQATVSLPLGRDGGQPLPMQPLESRAGHARRG